MEHLQHFGLSQDPFQNEPDLRFYYDSSSHRDVQRRVERGLRQSKGLSVLTGERETAGMIDLPEGVQASISSALGSSFAARAVSLEDQVYVLWTYTSVPMRGLPRLEAE